MTWWCSCQFGEGFAEGRTEPASHAGIDLVEDKGRDSIDGGQNRLHGEREPGKLAAGGDLAQRARLFPRIG